MPPLTWLHLSDLHACQVRSGWDAGRVRETLVDDLRALEQAHGLRPDLVFFTGDAAYGHLGNGPGERIEEQFAEAAGFLDAVCRAFTPEVPRSHLFLVPGNHDVDRRQVSPALTRWLAEQNDLDPVRRLIQDAGIDWRTGMARLAPYQEFLRASDLGHLLSDPERAIWSAVRTIRGLRVGIAGFNSAWSCGGDQEKGRLWVAGDWQQGILAERLHDVDVAIALIHHPPGWWVEYESHFPDLLRQQFQFLLHGHEHKEWVKAEDDGFTTLGAGACYDRSDRANGYNLVRLDPASGTGEVWLRQYDATGGGWVERRIHKQTDARGVRTLRPAWLRELAAAVEALPPATPPAPASSSPPAAAPELQDLPRYVQALRAAYCELLLLHGFATKVRVPIRLETVYVPLRARVVHHALESEHGKPGAFRELAVEAEDREVAFDGALALALAHGLRGAVVLGDPGTGKSTLLKHFLLAATEADNRLSLPQEKLPVFLELRRLKAPAAGLLAAMTEAVERLDPTLDARAFAVALYRHDHLLLLADGLDEIADPAERAAVSGWLEEAMGQLPHSLFVVTSRYAGYKDDARLTGRFLELHVRPLAEAESRRFVADWYSAVEEQAVLGRAPAVARQAAEEGIADLAGKLFDGGDPRTASLRELASNPLMLQILCLVHRDRKHLPERRVELYWECCQVLLELWRGAKKLPLTLTAAQALKLLQPLAHWLHANEKKEATAAEIQPLLAAPLRDLGRDPAEAEALLALIRDQSGILVNVGAAYTFLHLSFQEYLCARHLQDRIHSAPELLGDLAGHFGETWWREVILLAMGLDNPELFEPVMREILAREVLHRDVRLADDCLRDASAPTARPLLAALAEGVESAEERYHALRLLRDLPRWKSESLPDGTSGSKVVSLLAGDGDRQVTKMVAELLDLPTAAPRRGRRQEPISGEERRHEIDGTVLLYVPGGKYLLGANDLTEREKPVHRVILSPFWIAKYPVTNEQYERFLRAHPEAARPPYWQDKQLNQPNQPVVGVSWEEAQACSRWAGLALPSEAQWEAAARGTDGRRYPWGNDEPTAEHANFGGREGGPTPVGAFPRGAGPFGALDQAGNVWEWCADVWDEKAYRRRERAKENPVGTQGDAAVRCLHGGSWNDDARDLAAACRLRVRASLRHWIIGFRCVLPAGAEP